MLYNGAVYGRFDAIASAFPLLTLERYRTRWFAPAYALAIAAKTFPLFLPPPLALGHERQRPRRLLLAGGSVALLACPYLLTDPRGLLHALLYRAGSTPGGRLSWYLLPLQQHWLSVAQATAFAQGVPHRAAAGGALSPLRESGGGIDALRGPGPDRLRAIPPVGTPLPDRRGPVRPQPPRVRRGGAVYRRRALGERADLGAHTYTYLPDAPLPTPWPPLNALLALVILVFLVVQAVAGRPGLGAPGHGPPPAGGARPAEAATPLPRPTRGRDLLSHARGAMTPALSPDPF